VELEEEKEHEDLMTSIYGLLDSTLVYKKGI